MDSKDAGHTTVDVKLFFHQVTRGYSELADTIKNFSQNLKQYTPERILSECNKIQNKREKLTLLDQQLIKIVELANSEIRHETFVDEYRIAFNAAITASDDLHTHLVLAKAELLFSLQATDPN